MATGWISEAWPLDGFLKQGHWSHWFQDFCSGICVAEAAEPNRIVHAQDLSVHIARVYSVQM